MKRRNIRFATICLSLLVAAVSISIIAAPSLVSNAYAQPSGQQKGE